MRKIFNAAWTILCVLVSLAVFSPAQVFAADSTGYLKVTLVPQEAVDAGAQWSYDGGATWLDSDYVEELVSDIYTVSFKPIIGWTTPNSVDASVVEGNTTILTAGYSVATTGTLTVYVEPEAAVDAGSQWSYDGGATWVDAGSSATVVNGNYMVDFKPVLGWTPPAPIAVTVLEAEETSLTATYSPKPKGSLIVFAEPEAAVDAGAQWSVDGGATWMVPDSTTTLFVGDYTVEYKALTGWTSPAAAAVIVTEDDTTSLTAMYARQMGDLRVYIEPVDAVTSGAMWSADGGVTWALSGDVLTVPTGEVTVEFKDADGWTTPDDMVVTVDQGQLSERTVMYTKEGSLQVNCIGAGIKPKWRLNDGPWQENGAVIRLTPSDATTNYMVEFMDLRGFATPAPVAVDILLNELTEVTANYVGVFGELQVNMSPAEALTTGVMWRLDNGPWQESGAIISASVGTHVLGFVTSPGWLPPTNRNVEIPAGEFVVLDAEYLVPPGALCVTLLPQQVVLQGAKWKLDDGLWQDSGAFVQSVSAGKHTVSFKTVDGWLIPDSYEVTIEGSEISSLNMTYEKPALDLQLLNADFSAGTVTPLEPGAAVDISWDVYAADSEAGTFWCEIFASKTGGFDQVRFGSTMTNSCRQDSMDRDTTAHIAPTNQTLNTLPDGRYTVMPMVNRPTLPAPLAESNYVNNWTTIAGKRLAVNTPTVSGADLEISDVAVVLDVNSSYTVTIQGVVTNVGTEDLPLSGCWVETFYGALSAEGTVDPKGTIGNGTLIKQLAPGAQTSFTLTGKVPTGVEKRALATIADSTNIVNEVNKVNNTSLWYNPEILPAPQDNGIDLAITDFSVDAAQLAPVTVKPGDKLKMNVTVENKGTTTTSDKIWLEVFASQDGGVSFVRGATATESARIVLPELGESQTYTLNQKVNAIGDGVYTLVVVVNRKGAGNNPGDETPLDNRMAFSSGRISLQTPTTGADVNLVWSEGPEFAFAAGMTTVTGVVKNIGTDAAASFWTEAFVGRLEQQTGMYKRESSLAAGVLCNGLSAGEETTVTIVSKTTAAPGKVVGVLTDSTDLVAETEETDNYDYSNVVF